jgi:hypothetical protein
MVIRDTIINGASKVWLARVAFKRASTRQGLPRER